MKDRILGQLFKKTCLAQIIDYIQIHTKKLQAIFRSDNASLARLGIPAHTFSTSPMDKDLDYHKVTDEARTLNIETITQTIKAIAIGTESIITGEDTPTRVKL